MVTQNQPLMTSQSREDLSRVRITTHEDITQMIHLILRLYHRIPVLDHGFIHVIHILEPITAKSLTVLIKEIQYIGVIEMSVGYEPYVCHDDLSIKW